MKRTLSILLFLGICGFLPAQTNTLTLYTQPTCNNCKYAKAILQQNGIAFQNFSLEEKQHAVDMLNKLEKANYKSAIYLPVIFQNDTVLLYPQAQHNDSTLFFLLQDIVSNKATYKATVLPSGEYLEKVEQDNTDCDFNAANKYLVCANFKDEGAAERFKSVLIDNGYPYAGVVLYKDYYRVYAMMVFENENELDLLNNVRKQYRGAYIIEVNE